MNSGHWSAIEWIISGEIVSSKGDGDPEVHRRYLDGLSTSHVDHERFCEARIRNLGLLISGAGNYGDHLPHQYLYSA